ncbi:MAG: hypothetical protein EXR55_04315 [Dehalococcoidia bacterium]|nr:hypothetical protein [Dehalococcoidia bacterium]
MPSKGKRTAARQAELSQRKRRSDRPPQLVQSFQDRPSAPAEVTAETLAEVTVEGSKAALATPSPQPLRAPQLQHIHPYVVREMRRIGVFTGLLVVILVALTFLLR